MDQKKFNLAVGMAIRERREALGYAQDKFAYQNDKDRGYYWKIENGRINISVWQLRLLADKLDTTAYEIMKRADEIYPTLINK